MKLLLAVALFGVLAVASAGMSCNDDVTVFDLTVETDGAEGDACGGASIDWNPEDADPATTDAQSITFCGDGLYCDDTSCEEVPEVPEWERATCEGGCDAPYSTCKDSEGAVSTEDTDMCYKDNTFGGNCLANWDCKLGLSCNSDNYCDTPTGDDETECGAGWGNCGSANPLCYSTDMCGPVLAIDADCSDESSTAGICGAGNTCFQDACKALGSEGDECNGDNPGCNSVVGAPLYCYTKGDADDAVDMCHGLAEEGDECGTLATAFVACGSGLYCNDSDECAPTVADGEECPGGATSFGVDLGCTSGYCVPAANDACDGDYQCGAARNVATGSDACSATQCSVLTAVIKDDKCYNGEDSGDDCGTTAGAPQCETGLGCRCGVEGAETCETAWDTAYWATLAATQLTCGATCTSSDNSNCVAANCVGVSEANSCLQTYGGVFFMGFSASDADAILDAEDVTCPTAPAGDGGDGGDGGAGGSSASRVVVGVAALAVAAVAAKLA